MDYILLLRIQQWVKNLLIYFVLIAINQINQIFTIDSIIHFFSFSLMASTIYCINDIKDRSKDIQNIYKKKRPVANGKISVKKAIIISIFTFVFSLYLNFITGNLSTFFMLLGYFLLATLYTFLLKNFVFLDILILTSFYVLRIIYGSFAFDIELSNWLILFSFFFFFGLSSIKRLVSIDKLSKYSSNHIKKLEIFPQINLLIASILLVSYVFSQNAKLYYVKIEFLIISFFFIVFWNLNLIISAFKKKILIDPIEYCLKDKFSWIFFLLALFFYSLS